MATKNKSVITKISVGLVLFSQVTAHAVGLNLSTPRGEQTIKFNVPAQLVGSSEQEVCVVPKHYPKASYKKGDLKKEVKLCNYSFYPVTEMESEVGFKNTAVCPKLNSTNPGVNIFKAESLQSKATSEASLCKDTSGKIGKYKNSTSCSNTSSILSYYHVSRILGNIARVPVSVLRTMNRQAHLTLANKGVANTTEVLNQTWSGLQSILKTGLSHVRADNVLTSSGNQSYGAFVVNPKDEKFYKAFFNAGADRAEAFKNNSYYKMVVSSKNVSDIVGSGWSKENVQILVAMKDVTEFILLDYLLDQQDRFGNIASQVGKAYFVKDDDKDDDALPEMKIGDVDDFVEDSNEGKVVLGAGREPVLVEVMVLKDNDCGVTKENKIKKAGLLELINHLDPKTYKKLIQFDRSIDANKDFFITEMLMPVKEFNEFRANVKQASQMFYNKCKSGELKLDLDVDYYFEHGTVKQQSCEVE